MILFFPFENPWTDLAVVPRFGYLSQGVYDSYYWGEREVGVILEARSRAGP